MSTTQDSQLHALLTRLNGLSEAWLIQSGKDLARANRLGNCTAGLVAATEAGMLRGCAQRLSAAITSAIAGDGTGPGAELTAADVDVLVITAAELWDFDDVASDALSERQREVLAKARDIYRRTYEYEEN